MGKIRPEYENFTLRAKSWNQLSSCCESPLYKSVPDVVRPFHRVHKRNHNMTRRSYCYCNT